MDIETLTIQTTAIEIHVVKVGGSKLTLSVFRQIPIANPFDFDDDSDKEFKFNRNQIVGWINHYINSVSTWILVQKNGSPFRVPVKPHHWLTKDMLTGSCGYLPYPKHVNLMPLLQSRESILESIIKSADQLYIAI